MNEEVNYIQLQQPVIVQCLRTPHTRTNARAYTLKIHTGSHDLCSTHTQTHTNTRTESDLSDDSDVKVLCLSPGEPYPISGQKNR